MTGYVVLPEGTGWKLVNDMLAVFYDLGQRLYQSGTLGKLFFYVGVIFIGSLLGARIRHLFTRHRRR